jgi:hypothetical protein
MAPTYPRHRRGNGPNGLGASSEGARDAFEATQGHAKGAVL